MIVENIGESVLKLLVSQKRNYIKTLFSKVTLVEKEGEKKK